MIKRDTIQRVIVKETPDNQGGSAQEIEEKEILSVAVSITSSFGTIGPYGPVQQQRITVVSDVKLDEYVNARYKYSGRLFRLMFQLKRGNEYYSTLIEVVN